MATIAYDGKAFIVNGHRVWVVSGAVHYFRVPRELWRDRLTKLQRAGCNTVETYVAWNVHEPREGEFDFSGDADLDAYLSLAEEMGLWIIVRPGPYICSEWDNGGIPAWLNVKPGIKLRVANNVYHRHISAFFERLMPIVARHQVTRGGRVILVQDENEYVFHNRPGGREHLEFLRDLMRRLGIEVPILVCNFLRERIEGTVECWNGWDDLSRAVRSLENAQPNAPKLITEFWTGWFDVWGEPSREGEKSAREVHARSMRLAAEGAMYNYYMFHGGTNFGWYPGRTETNSGAYITSSYDSYAPVAETGALTEKYYKAKLASVLASNMGAFLAESEPADLPVTSGDDVEILGRSGPQGNVIFVFNHSTRRRTATLTLPGGVSIEASFADHDALALPFHFSPVAGFTIDYANVSILAMMPMGIGRLIFLHGPRGKAAVLSAQGRTFRRMIGADTQMWFGNFPNLIAVMDTARAERTWFLPDRTVVGGDYAGEADAERVEVACRGEEETLAAYFPNGKVNFAVSRGKVEAPALPRLTGWKKRGLLPAGRPAGAVRVDDGKGGFQALEALGYFGGYGWYYTKIEAQKAGREALLFTDAEDRLTVFANGRREGVFGRGAGATMGTVNVTLKKGANDVHVLFDNLGRYNYGFHVGERKGIRGPVYLGGRAASPHFAWTAGRYNGKLAACWQIETNWPDAKDVAATLAMVFEAGEGEGAVLRFGGKGIGEPAAVFINREFQGYYWGNWDSRKCDITVPAGEVQAGRNLIEICFFVKPEREVARDVTLYLFEESRRVAGEWFFAPMGARKAKAAGGARAAAGMPTAWETTFRLEKPAAPVELVCEGLRKGEVWLNGRMVSRHWDVGPRRRVYLPEPWLEGKNRLVIIDEAGASPARARLEYDERGVMRHERV